MTKTSATSKKTVSHIEIAHTAIDERSISQHIVGSIVELFTNNITYIDKNGEVVEYNTHKYSLINALNGLAFSMSRQRLYVVDQVDKARTEAKAALMAATGNEISMNKLRIASERLDQREDELFCVDTLLDQSVKAYEALASKKFEFKGKPTETPVVNVNTENADVQAMARRLGINLDSIASNTDEVGNEVGLAGSYAKGQRPLARA